jgi:hypothetical protein
MTVSQDKISGLELEITQLRSSLNLTTGAASEL